MPAIKAIKQKELIRFLRKLDFIGPYSGGKHQFMVKEDLRIMIPYPHKKDIGKNLLKLILKDADLSHLFSRCVSTISFRLSSVASTSSFWTKY